MRMCILSVIGVASLVCLKTCSFSLKPAETTSCRKMPEKKKTVKFPPGATEHLKASESGKKQWSEGAEQLADRLAHAEWHSYNSRPRGNDSSGYFVILRWYGKEKVWVPLFLQRGNVGSLLSKVYGGKKTTPICKYLSSFPRSQRNLLWVKWVCDAPSSATIGKETTLRFREVLQAFSSRYNQGELLPFNMDEEPQVPENFSLLDY